MMISHHWSSLIIHHASSTMKHMGLCDNLKIGCSKYIQVPHSIQWHIIILPIYGVKRHPSFFRQTQLFQNSKKKNMFPTTPMIRIKAQVGFVTHDSRSLSGFGILFPNDQFSILWRWAVYRHGHDKIPSSPGIECLSGHLLLILDPLLRLVERTGQGAPGCPRVPQGCPNCRTWIRVVDGAGWIETRVSDISWNLIWLIVLLWLLKELSIPIILPWMMIATESYFSWGGLFETTNQRWQWPPARSVRMKNDLGPIPPGHPDLFINKQSLAITVSHHQSSLIITNHHLTHPWPPSWKTSFNHH